MHLKSWIYGGTLIANLFANGDIRITLNRIKGNNETPLSHCNRDSRLKKVGKKHTYVRTHVPLRQDRLARYSS